MRRPNALSVLVSRIQQIDMAESMNLQVHSPSCKQCNKLKELKCKVYGFLKLSLQEIYENVTILLFIGLAKELQMGAFSLDEISYNLRIWSRTTRF